MGLETWLAREGCWEHLGGRAMIRWPSGHGLGVPVSDRGQQLE